jgi:hypothetical protein
MQRASVVPDDQITDRPRVRVNELRLRRVLHELADQHASVRHRPANNVGGVRTILRRRLPGRSA